MNYKKILWNSFFLIFVEAITVALLFVIYNVFFIESGYLDFVDKVKDALLGLVGMFFYGFAYKSVLELIPKILIQYFVIKKFLNSIQMFQLWIYLFFYGIVMSVFWWSLTHFQFKINLYTITAIFNLFAIAISPFILKRLGWDIIEKATQVKPEETKK